MADLDFPLNPQINDLYTFNDRTFRYDGSKWRFVNVSIVTVNSGSAITSINSLTNSFQNFSVGNVGSGFNISSVGLTHTFNIPFAGSGSTGLVTTTTQTIAGQKTFSSNVTISSSLASTNTSSGALIVTGGASVGDSLNIAGRINLWNSNNYTAFVSSASGNTLYVLPPTTPATGSSVLQSTSAGILSWVPMVASGAASGFTNLNGVIDGIQYFSTGVSGTGFNISSSGSTHTFNVPIASTGATGLVSTLSQSFSGAKTFTNDLIISSTTGSTYFANGSLTVYGGLGVSGQLSFNRAAMGYTGSSNPSLAFIGSTTSAPITLTVLSDNSLIFEGTSGKLFGINNNLSSGWIFNVGDISGLPLIRANADGTIAMAEFAGNVGVGISNPSYKLHVTGSVGFTASTQSTSTTTGALVVSGGVGIGQSVSVGGRLQLFNSSNYTAFVSSASGNTVYTLPASSPATGSSVLSSTAAGVMSWVPMTSGSGSVNSGTATYAAFYASSTNAVSENANIQFTGSGVSVGGNINSVSTRSGSLYVSGGVGFTGNAFIGGTTTIQSSASSISSSTGSLVVSGGVGIGGSLYVGNTSRFEANTASVSTSTGAVVVSGGVGVGGSLYVGGPSRFSDSSQSNTINSGAIVVTGGAGIAQSVSIGGRLQLFNGANYTSFVSSASGNTVYTLPATSPAIGTSYLVSTSAGVMSWTRPKRSYVLSFGAGFTPSANAADTIQLNIPYAPDNVSLNYIIKRIEYRNETSVGGTGLSFYLQRHTAGNAAWTTANTILAGSGASFEVGASVYQTNFTTINSSSGTNGLVASGDYLRLFFTTVGSAANVSLSIMIEEQ